MFSPVLRSLLSTSALFQDGVAEWIVVDVAVGADAGDEQFTVALHVVSDVQQSRRQSLVEQDVAVGVAVEQRPTRTTRNSTTGSIVADGSRDTLYHLKI